MAGDKYDDHGSFNCPRQANTPKSHTTGELIEVRIISLKDLYNDLLALPSMQNEEERDMSGCSDPDHCPPTFYEDAEERNELRSKIRKELTQYLGIKEG
jgi:hypothetical protein